MENPTYIALSRLMAQQRTMDVVANNIANSNTPGFRSEHVLFSDWLLPAHGRALASGEPTIAFSQDRATWRDQTPGAVTHTGNPLDLAIGSQGFFSVSTPSGVRLTRSGRFTLQNDGTVVDSSGHALLDDGGSPIILSGGGEVSVAGDGTISTETGRVVKVGIVDAADQNRLMPEGDHLFRADTSTSTDPRPTIVQGGIESSNVSPMLEMTNMMQLGRDFQFMSQFVQSESERQQNAIDKITAEPQA